MNKDEEDEDGDEDEDEESRMSASEMQLDVTDDRDGGAVVGAAGDGPLGRNTANRSVTVDDKDDDTEMGYLAKIKMNLRKDVEKKKQEAEEDRALREAHVTEWREWSCVVCGTFNRRPAEIPQEFGINFGTKGVYFKRHYAKLTPKSRVPTCLRCSASANYVPNLSNAHLFKFHPHPDAAFANYPKKVAVQAELKTDPYSMYLSSTYSFFFGITDHPKSLLVANDWRLPKYLATQFPELPRHFLGKQEYFQVGEFLECGYQKVDWTRCRVTGVHLNHTYNIK